MLEQHERPPTPEKKKKDPNAPKRNLSSYMLYSQAVRPSVVAKNPELKAVEVAKIIGDQWNALTDKEKQPYVKQAAKEKARFDKENKNYQDGLLNNNNDNKNLAEVKTEATTAATLSESSSSSSEEEEKPVVKRKAEPTSEPSPSKKKSKKSKKNSESKKKSSKNK